MIRSARARKRAVDVVLGSLLALAALPIILILAAIQAVTLRCWPFFVQERIATGGVHRRFPKIRSLPKSTPAYALKTRQELSTTRFSRLLRSAHLDELPQLLLVPVGKLSLVGPRPKMPQRFEPTCDVYASSRVEVPQGCTGLWQISVDRDGLPQDAPQYDLFYLTHATVAMDMWILWRTFCHMLRLRPPITLADVPEWTMGTGFALPEAREGSYLSSLGSLRVTIDLNLSRRDLALLTLIAAQDEERETTCLGELLTEQACASCAA